MKTLAAIFFGGFISFAAAQTHDVRKVDGVAVDIGPLLDWCADQKGERPLKHWKQIAEPVWVESVAGSYSKVSGVIEGGGRSTILLKNLTVDVRDYNRKLDDLRLRKSQLALWCADEKKRLDELEAITPVVPTGNADQRKRALNARRKLDREQEQLGHKLDELNTLKSAYERLAREFAAEKILAMNTGKKYAGFDVWDCGAR